VTYRQGLEGAADGYPDLVKTVVLDPAPVEVQQLIKRRHQLGLDLFDEMWEGTYHMAPAPRFGHADLDQQLAVLLDPLATQAGLVTTGPFNLGQPDDFRVPDRGVHRGRPDPQAVYLDTAAAVIEIVSPDDETHDKLPFYPAHKVDEVWIVDPAARHVQILIRNSDHYQNANTSPLLGARTADLDTHIRWPPAT